MRTNDRSHAAERSGRMPDLAPFENLGVTQGHRAPRRTGDLGADPPDEVLAEVDDHPARGARATRLGPGGSRRARRGPDVRLEVDGRGVDHLDLRRDGRSAAATSVDGLAVIKIVLHGVGGVHRPRCVARQMRVAVGEDEVDLGDRREAVAVDAVAPSRSGSRGTTRCRA